MDILANNNWERPVYFASLGHEGTLGLENFMQLEGFAYRLVPIYSPGGGRYEAGRVQKDRLYENLMEKFRYGRMNEPDVYLDDFHVRTTSVIRLRTRFVQLANALISSRDTSRAVQVLDKCMELTPDEKIPYDYNVIQVAAAYYKCGSFEKANALVEKLADISNVKLEYYLDQELKFIASINDEVLYNFQVLQNLINISKTYNQEDISKKLEGQADSLYSIYTTKTARVK
jgi:tetratricopeptide (TPR) repeat protein